MSTRASGRSTYTPWKDEHVPVVAQKVLAVAHNAVRKWGGHDRLLLVDLTAGAGVEPDGRRSLALCILDWALQQAKPVEAHLCEQDSTRFRALAAATAACYAGRPGIAVATYEGDCHTHVGEILASAGGRLRAARKRPHDLYGLLLADPCGFVPWDAVHRVAQAYPRIDVLLYMGAATPKWHGRTLSLPTLEQQLRALGKTQRPLISEPRGNYQWVMILASSFPYGRSAKHGLEYLDSDRGREWFERALLTREQRLARYQPTLWPARTMETS